MSELIYTLKYAANGASNDELGHARRALFKVLEVSNNVEYIAHAISALESLLRKEDLAELERVSRAIVDRKLRTPRSLPDPDNRVPVYLEAAILRLRAKLIADDPKNLPVRPGEKLVSVST